MKIKVALPILFVPGIIQMRASRRTNSY